MSLPWSVFCEYYLAITPLEAEEACISMNVAAYPHLKASKAKEVFGAFKRLTKIVEDDVNGKVMTTKDFAINLARRITGGK